MTRRTEPARRAPVRALITDIDGTLTDQDRRIYFPAIEAVSQLRARGFPVLFASGNVLPVILGLQRFLGLQGPIIAENGGLLYYGGDRVERLCRRSVALQAYRVARRTLPVRRLFTDRWRETEVALESNVDPRKVERAVRGLGVKVESTGFAIHLFEPTGGKLPAATRALRELGLSLSDCLVTGDGDNDVELLRAAGVAVSFPNGSKRARDAADLVTERSYGAGFLEALIRYRLLAGPRRGRVR